MDVNNLVKAASAAAGPSSRRPPPVRKKPLRQTTSDIDTRPCIRVRGTVIYYTGPNCTGRANGRDAGMTEAVVLQPKKTRVDGISELP